ncbi:MAG TPA: cupin domain-containing protein [Mucilaginibacter sp.]
MNAAAYWINRLQLQPHPEGGYYKEVFRSEIEVTSTPLCAFKKACTSIYYLLEDADYSGFHRITSDELWYFHKGDPLNIHVITPDGTYNIIELSDTETGNLSAIVTAGSWFGANIPSGSGFTLVSCAVAPGFEFTDFEMAEKARLLSMYPQHEAIINKLCR